jgi:hypothetical protein
MATEIGSYTVMCENCRSEGRSATKRENAIAYWNNRKGLRLCDSETGRMVLTVLAALHRDLKEHNSRFVPHMDWLMSEVEAQERGWQAKGVSS